MNSKSLLRIISTVLIIIFLVSCREKNNKEESGASDVYFNKLNRAAQEFENNNNAEAEKLLKQAQNIEPTMPMAFYMHGMIHYRKANREEAGTLFRKTLDRCNEEERINCITELDKLTESPLTEKEQSLITESFASITNKNYGAALTALKEAHKLNPGNVAVLYGIGYCYSQEKDYAKAALHLEKARAIHPAHSRSLKELAQSYAKLKQYDKLIAVLNDTINYIEKSDETQYRLGEAYYLAGKLDQAILVLERNVRDFASFTPSYLVLGKIYSEQNEHSLAKERLEHYLKYSSNSDTRRGEAEALIKKIDESI